MSFGRQSRETRSNWQAVRGAIHELSEDGEGAPREEAIERAALLAGIHTEKMRPEVEEMERRGEVYRVNGHLKDTNATLNGDHP